uniref:AarF domain containing kinase 1 n=1 Tax=Hucho hucho TaxID=62062 RepID=A0A4W5KCC0_9TELE
MAGRLLKVSSVVTAVVASSGFYLYNNKQLDPNDISLVRFGRAAATTAVISYDYMTSLKHVEYGSEEYRALKSQVSLGLGYMAKISYRVCVCVCVCVCICV